jgi:hypothetical protein
MTGALSKTLQKSRALLGAAFSFVVRIPLIAGPGILGAFLSRWHGGGFISGTPKLVKAFLWSAPLALCSVFAHLPDTKFFVYGIGVSICALIGCAVLIWSMVFKNTGHGGGMDVAHSPKEPGAGRKPEKLEYLILWLHGRIPQFWYDVLLLAVIGAFSMAGAAVALGTVNIGAGLIVLAGGALGKPVGYVIGHALADAGLLKNLPEDLDHGTAIGETLTGFFAYACLATATMMVIP